jgi:hypothetical protein
MPARAARHDQYGRPLPTPLTAAPVPSREESAKNLQQRHRLRGLLATLEQRFPELLRPGVNAEVTIVFKIGDGTIHEEWLIDIVHRYRREDE